MRGSSDSTSRRQAFSLSDHHGMINIVFHPLGESLHRFLSKPVEFAAVG